MNAALITAVLDWPTQKADFEPDGSLRDIYVQGATIDDWKLVIEQIVHGNYRARLHHRGAEVSLPTEVEARFDGHSMSFTVGDIVLARHFFTPTEIEFSFAPNDVTETSVRHLLAFMIDVGEVIRKPVIMTPENCRQSPIFRYDANELRWIPPHSS